MAGRIDDERAKLCTVTQQLEREREKNKTLEQKMRDQLPTVLRQLDEQLKQVKSSSS